MKTKMIQLEKLAPSPTLNTVLMVEKTLEDMDNSVFSIADIKKKLPRQVNHNTLMVILDYLEKSNKIYVSVRGISWLQNPNPVLRVAVAKGREL